MYFNFIEVLSAHSTLFLKSSICVLSEIALVFLWLLKNKKPLKIRPAVWFTESQN
jgi:hypothetical protein